MTLAAMLHKVAGGGKHSAFSHRDIRIPAVEKAIGTGTFNPVEQRDLKLISCLCKVPGNASLTPADLS